MGLMAPHLDTTTSVNDDALRLQRFTTREAKLAFWTKIVVLGKRAGVGVCLSVWSKLQDTECRGVSTPGSDPWKQ